MAWKAIARCAIGTSHFKQQLPCQNYGGYKILNSVMLGVVADGAGSAKYADVGAKLAVQTVLKYLTGIEAWLQKRKRFWQFHPQLLTEAQARKLFAKQHYSLAEYLARSLFNFKVRRSLFTNSNSLLMMRSLPILTLSTIMNANS